MAEAEAGLPAGLLLAVGKVESGRTSPVTGRLAPWPFAVDLGGRGVLAADRDAAVAEVLAARAGGMASVDVGCFQVSLLYHPEAFDSLEAAFEPLPNARYAAAFLASLRAGASSWEEAAGRYHSMTPALAAPYAARVMAAWSGLDAGPVRLDGQWPGAPGLRFGMRVYTPGAGEAAAPVATPAVRPISVAIRPGTVRGRLPLVFGPGGRR